MIGIASMNAFESSNRFKSRDLLTAPQSCVDHITTCNLANEWRGSSVKCIIPGDLRTKDKKRIFQIFEKNMKHWYLKNWGWDEVEKKKELFHPNSRFLCVYASPRSEDITADGSGPSSSRSATKIDRKEEELIAFVMFRFEWDDEDEPEHPVVFCYEIQVCEDYRGQSLGKHVSCGSVIKIVE